MAQSLITIKKEIIDQLFKSAPPEFTALLRQTTGASHRRAIFDPPRNNYPLFEHLLLFLYSRHFSKDIQKSDIFGHLSTAQKICIGEAIDILIYLNFLPAHTITTPRLSLLQLCYHDRFGFKDDPVLLQKMWYVRAHVLLLDSAEALGSGGRWKWYDHHLTLVIYSWVRHNRKYHGCPKESCHCRHMIDLYSLSIQRFKGLYMALEKQCVSQLQFIRANDPVWMPAEGSSSLSRAMDGNLYEKPTRPIWPPCLVDKAAEPDPPDVSPEVETPSFTLPPPPTLTSSTLVSTLPLTVAQPPPPTTPAPKLPGLPPPHPSLPARPKTYDLQQTFPPQQRVWQMQFPPGYSSNTISTNPAPAAQPTGQFPTVPHTSNTEAQPPPTAPRSMQTQGYRYPPAVGNMSTPFTPQPQAVPPPTNTSPTFQMKIGPPSRQTVIDMPAVKIGPPVSRAKMFPPPNAPTGPSAANRAASTAKEVNEKAGNAPATPSSAASTPSMDPASPIQSIQSQSSTDNVKLHLNTGNTVDKTNVIIPSAPRSMRAAAANAKAGGVIPTGPRALMGVSKTSAAGNMAGVPSGPRALRGVTTNVKLGVSSTNNNSSAAPLANNSLKDGSDSARAAQDTPGKAVGEDMPVSSTAPLASADPVNPQPVTGKRTRSETKEDETKASSELKEKKTKQEDEGVEPDEMQRTPTRANAIGHETSSLPPSKRIRHLVEPESPSSSKGRATRTSTPVESTNVAVRHSPKPRSTSQNGEKLEIGTVPKKPENEPKSSSQPTLNISPVEVIETNDVNSPVKKIPSISKAAKTKAKSKTASPLPNSKTNTPPVSQGTPAEKAPERRKAPKGVENVVEQEKAEPKTRAAKAKAPSSRSKAKATKEPTVDLNPIPETKKFVPKEDKTNLEPTAIGGMELDTAGLTQVHSDTSTAVLSTPTNFPPPRASSGVVSADIIASLRSGPPFPSVIIYASDPETRMQSHLHEARRLICLMIWLGVSLDWDSVYITGDGIAIRDTAMAMVIASLTEEKVTKLVANGISIAVTPFDSLSDTDSDMADTQLETNRFVSKELKLSVPEGDGVIRLFDGLEERRLRLQEAERRRLLQMVTVLLQWEGMDDHEMKAESMVVGNTFLTALVFSKAASETIDSARATVLGDAGISVYLGTTQIAGPVSMFIRDITSPTLGQATHDWRSMQAEVAKMRLPWESPPRKDSFSSPATSVTFPTRGSSFDSSDSRFNQSHYSYTSEGATTSPYAQLLRPALWSSSATIMTRMAAAGLRWDGLESEEVEWSDVSDDEEELEEVKLGASISS